MNRDRKIRILELAALIEREMTHGQLPATDIDDETAQRIAVLLTRPRRRRKR